MEPSWHRNLRRDRAAARRRLHTGDFTRLLTDFRQLQNHHGSCPPRQAAATMAHLRASSNQPYGSRARSQSPWQPFLRPSWQSYTMPKQSSSGARSSAGDHRYYGQQQQRGAQHSGQQQRTDASWGHGPRPVGAQPAAAWGQSNRQRKRSGRPKARQQSTNHNQSQQRQAQTAPFPQGFQSYLAAEAAPPPPVYAMNGHGPIPTGGFDCGDQDAASFLQTCKQQGILVPSSIKDAVKNKQQSQQASQQALREIQSSKNDLQSQYCKLLALKQRQKEIETKWVAYSKTVQEHYDQQRAIYRQLHNQHIAQIAEAQAAISSAKEQVTRAIGGIQLDSDSSEAPGRSPSWDSASWQQRLYEQEAEQQREINKDRTPIQRRRPATPARRQRSPSTGSPSSSPTVVPAPSPRAPTPARSAFKAPNTPRSASRVTFNSGGSDRSESLGRAAARPRVSAPGPAPQTPQPAQSAPAAVTATPALPVIRHESAAAQPAKKSRGSEGRSRSLTREGEDVPIPESGTDTAPGTTEPTQKSKTQQRRDMSIGRQTRGRASSLGAFGSRRSVQQLQQQAEADRLKQLASPRRDLPMLPGMAGYEGTNAAPDPTIPAHCHE